MMVVFVGYQSLNESFVVPRVIDQSQMRSSAKSDVSVIKVNQKSIECLKIEPSINRVFAGLTSPIWAL